MRQSPAFASLPAERPVLRVRFQTLEAFRKELQANLSKGGLFIPTGRAFELRQEVEIELDLAFRNARERFAGEVVAVVGEDLARAGGTPGIAVQLLAEVAEVRRRLEPLAGSPPEPEAARRVGERRAARRLPARVMGVLSTADAHLSVRTRDLSSSGVLVTLEGVSPAPVGETVRLSLPHPRTGEALEVEGQVVRHLESDGGVPALAVAFTEEEALRPDVARFVEDLGSMGHARSLAAVRGDLATTGLATLLQDFSSAAPVGTLTVSRGAEEGWVVFRDGRLCAARLGSVSGTKALSRMLAWEEGHFELQPHAEDGLDDEEALGIEHALLDATRQLDERARLGPPPVSLDARLRAESPPAEEEAAQRTKTEEAVIDLARAGLPVRAILDVIPEEDAAVLQALTALLEQGVLGVRS